jgi:1-acyl-sn-glycerol-3-phosphate acyltransferase
MARTVLDIARTSIGLLAVAIYVVFVGLYVIVVANIWPRAKHLDACVRGWGILFGFATGTRMDVEGLEHIDRSTSFVVVSNHLSNLDPPLHIATLPIPIRFLAKKELFRIPIFGRAMRAVGMIETDREAHASAHRAINERVAWAVGLGKSLIIYPEGHRSRDADMKPFKKGAFRIAIDVGLPILPVAISGTERAWKPGDRLVHGGRCRMVIHEPIPTEGMGKDDIAGLRDRAEEIVAASYERIRIPA